MGCTTSCALAAVEKQQDDRSYHNALSEGPTEAARPKEPPSTAPPKTFRSLIKLAKNGSSFKSLTVCSASITNPSQNPLSGSEGGVLWMEAVPVPQPGSSSDNKQQAAGKSAQSPHSESDNHWSSILASPNGVSRGRLVLPPHPPTVPSSAPKHGMSSSGHLDGLTPVTGLVHSPSDISSALSQALQSGHVVLNNDLFLASCSGHQRGSRDSRDKGHSGSLRDDRRYKQVSQLFRADEDTSPAVDVPNRYPDNLMRPHVRGPADKHTPTAQHNHGDSLVEEGIYMELAEYGTGVQLPVLPMAPSPFAMRRHASSCDAVVDSEAMPSMPRTPDHHTCTFACSPERCVQSQPWSSASVLPSRASSLGSLYCQSSSAGAIGPAQRRLSKGNSGNLSCLTDVSESSTRLFKLVEHLMLTDVELYRRVQQSSAGISSLAKETHALQHSRDTTGATCVNQYVVIKTLGRGSFGKVKLCLNTLDGIMYAVKIINRLHIQQQLQRPLRSLRRKTAPFNTLTSPDLRQDLSRAMYRMPSLPDIMEGDSSNVLPAVSTGVSDVDSCVSSLMETRPLASSGGATGGGGAGRDGDVPLLPDSPGVSFVQTRSTRQSLDSNRTCGSPLGTGCVTEGVMREIAVMKKLDHPNIVKLHEVIDSPGSPDLVIIMEYCEGGPVMETRGQSGFKRLSEDQACEMARQLCSGLDYLHYNSIVHGDLKPENLLLAGDGVLKIADFGSSSVVSVRAGHSRFSCTPAFQPPCQLDKTFSRAIPPFAGDIWAMGCVVYCFVFGRLPFQGSCVVDISHSIVADEAHLPDDVVVSAELKDLLHAIFIKDPYQRINLQAIMEHPWITRHGTAPLISMHRMNMPPQRIVVSSQDCCDAIDHGSLVSLLRARLAEKNVQAGEYLYKEGEEAHCIYMIMSGTVELVTDLSHLTYTNRGNVTGPLPTAPSGSSGAALFTRQLTGRCSCNRRSGPVDWSAVRAFACGASPRDSSCGPPSNTGVVHGAPGSHTGCGAMSGEVNELGSSSSRAGSFSVELDDSLTLDCSTVSAIAVAAEANAEGKLHIDRGRAQDLMKRMMDAALLSNPEYVLEVKGPGQVLGLLAITPCGAPQPVHMHSARAREDVVVVKLSEEAFIEAAMHKFGLDVDSIMDAAAGTAANLSSKCLPSRSNSQRALGGGRGSAGSVLSGPMATCLMDRACSRELVMVQGLEDLEMSLVGGDTRTSAGSMVSSSLFSASRYGGALC